MHEPFEAPSTQREPLPRSVTVERAVLAGLMAALCVITMANVIVRYFTNVSFAFTEEISISLMVVMTLLGAATAFHRGKHIAITFLVDRLAPAARRWVAMLGLAACVLMFGLLAWYGARMAWDDYRYDVTSPALGIPQWLYTVWLPVLSLLIAARVASLMVVHLKREQ